MILKGKTHIFGDNIDTDVIIPARYLTTVDPAELAKNCMVDIDDTFTGRVQNGDIITAGLNFGCGSSREHAPVAIKGCGVSCVLARSFARIFYRNSINIGLPILECDEILDEMSPGDELTVDLTTGEITNVTTGMTYQSEPFPEFILGIIEAGGEIAYLKEKFAKRG